MALAVQPSAVNTLIHGKHAGAHEAAWLLARAAFCRLLGTADDIREARRCEKRAKALDPSAKLVAL